MQIERKARFKPNPTGSLKKRAIESVASETRCRRLFEAAQDGVLILDPRTGDDQARKGEAVVASPKYSRAVTIKVRPARSMRTATGFG